MKKIVITGIGAVTPIGIGVEEYWKNLLAGKCGIDYISRFDTSDFHIKVAAEVKNFDPGNYMPINMVKDAALFSQFAYVSTQEALEQSGLDCDKEAKRIGVVMGTAMGGVVNTASGQEQMTATGKMRVNPKLVTKILGNVAAAQIAIEKHLSGPCYTISTACSSGGDAIKLGNMLLQAGEADAVLAVGGESIICPLVTSSLSMARALSRASEPQNACRPFDTERDGFVMGEGGGAIILETEEHAVKRGADILGVLIAAANNTDGYHVTAPAPDGHGAIACMKDAIEISGLNPEDIGYINAHGTSTPVGDIIELGAIKSVFGEKMPYVSSTKGATGHMMGAGGITEVITCLLACRDGILPHTINVKKLDDACEGVPVIINESKRVNIKAAMSNAFGFGGQNSSIIVSAF